MFMLHKRHGILSEVLYFSKGLSVSDVPRCTVICFLAMGRVTVAIAGFTVARDLPGCSHCSHRVLLLMRRAGRAGRGSVFTTPGRAVSLDRWPFRVVQPCSRLKEFFRLSNGHRVSCRMSSPRQKIHLHSHLAQRAPGIKASRRRSSRELNASPQDACSSFTNPFKILSFCFIS